jgi:hypothetical protein
MRQMMFDPHIDCLVSQNKFWKPMQSVPRFADHLLCLDGRCARESGMSLPIKMAYKGRIHV